MYKVPGMPHISISLLNFGGVASRISFTSSANTPKLGGKVIHFFLRKASIFLETYFHEHTFLKMDFPSANKVNWLATKFLVCLR